MLKKVVILSMVAFLASGGILLKKNNVFAEENDGCYVLFDGTIVCDEDIPEGCSFNPELKEIVCEVEPLENKGDPGIKG